MALSRRRSSQSSSSSRLLPGYSRQTGLRSYGMDCKRSYAVRLLPCSNGENTKSYYTLHVQRSTWGCRACTAHHGRGEARKMATNYLVVSLRKTNYSDNFSYTLEWAWILLIRSNKLTYNSDYPIKATRPLKKETMKLEIGQVQILSKFR